MGWRRCVRCNASLQIGVRTQPAQLPRWHNNNESACTQHSNVGSAGCRCGGHQGKQWKLARRGKCRRKSGESSGVHSARILQLLMRRRAFFLVLNMRFLTYPLTHIHTAVRILKYFVSTLGKLDSSSVTRVLSFSVMSSFYASYFPVPIQLIKGKLFIWILDCECAEVFRSCVQRWLNWFFLVIFPCPGATASSL